MRLNVSAQWAACMLALALLGIGMNEANAVQPSANTVTIATKASPFAAPVVLRGNLGDRQIQMQLRPKQDIDEGVEGNYFVFGQAQKILLAGEIEEQEFWLEESVNGTDVSGQWQGERQGSTLRGSWSSADNALTLPFQLQIVGANAASKKQIGKPSTKAIKAMPASDSR